jgi:transposase
MTQEQMKHDSDIEDVAIDSTSARPRSMPMPKPSDSSVVVVPQKRRRFSAQEKLELVRLTYLPGNTVSSVARQYGLQPSLLFRWRTLEKAGGLVAVQSGEQTVSASKYAEALDEIKRLQRLLGQVTADNALLKDAVELMQSKKWIAR